MDNLESQSIIIPSNEGKSLHTKYKRNLKGAAPPVQIPILLFVYTIIFLVMVEFVMLFWLQSSLDTAARQIALVAASNSSVPLDQSGAVEQRCRLAAQQVGQVFPGYSVKVRADYVNAVVNGNKTAPLSEFDEVDSKGQLRGKLVELGAQRPSTFWGGSPRGGPGNMLYGGCYAIKNPITNNIVFHSVVHCAGCWPIFLKGFFMDSNRTTNVNAQAGKRVFSLSGWLEGRGSYPATQSGGGDKLDLNKSLISSGPRPIAACTDDQCDVDGGGDQNKVFPGAKSGGTEVCPPFDDQVKQAVKESRPAANQVSMATGKKVFSIDQWPAARGALCARCNKCSVSYVTTKTSGAECKGEDIQPAGLTRFANCGDIDPLIFVGMRYACMGVDGFGRVIKTSGGTGGAGGELAEDYIGRCDHFFALKPACAQTFVSMDKTVGDVTNLNEANGPCVIRREKQDTSETKFVCRNDSKTVLPWLGPYSGGPASAEAEYTAATKTFSIDGLNSIDLLKTNESLDGPLDNAIPYHAVCDICNPGSPKCGMYGTCRDESNLWPAAGPPGGDSSDSLVVAHFQLWTNTPFYSLNPVYGQLQCRYRRDCKERHCCWSAMEEGLLTPYCEGRQIQGGPVRTGNCCWGGCNTWTYHGVPNMIAMAWTPNSLPRLGGFPHCSSGAVKVMRIGVGECCAPDVQTAVLPCGPELAPPVQLMEPIPCAPTRECEGGRMSSKFCSGKPPSFDGNGCLDGNYPIGGETPGGPGGMPGTVGPVPKGALPTSSMCSVNPDNPTPSPAPPNKIQCNGVRQSVSKNGSPVSGGGTTTTSTCTTYITCSGTPIVLAFDETQEPVFADKKVCFQLDATKLGMSYRWLKGNKKQGFLACDFDKNGKIDNGMELFGTLTNNRYYPNGYAALGFQKDKNTDGLITGQELDDLVVWFDDNEDGESQASELKPVKDLGIVELDAGLYQNKHRNKKILSKDGLAYTKYYSAKGYKLKEKSGEIKTGYSWDIIFQGSLQNACLVKQEREQKFASLKYSVEDFFRKLSLTITKPFQKQS